MVLDFVKSQALGDADGGIEHCCVQLTETEVMCNLCGYDDGLNGADGEVVEKMRVIQRLDHRREELLGSLHAVKVNIEQCSKFSAVLNGIDRATQDREVECYPERIVASSGTPK